ncbi:hypothetical protein ACN38_g12429 [Penicillium nordicum]|uniref:Uncharacterized protein n=1 Tax=Penicillium nordicum TaxID=229535 RepID=A0A0M8NQQ6_9EURO|nr:hypothetical protein ACN38_g12429 [Penicillium nordicum]
MLTPSRKKCSYRSTIASKSHHNGETTFAKSIVISFGITIPRLILSSRGSNGSGDSNLGNLEVANALNSWSVRLTFASDVYKLRFDYII